MLTTLTTVLRKAEKKQYAVGAFNINNLETLQAVLHAAQKQHSPVIIQTSEGAIDYAGLDYLSGLVKIAAANSNIPVVLHLDHGQNIPLIKKCIAKGYTSIMIDASHKPFTQNVRITKKITRLAHRKGVSVEGELGTIGGTEDTITQRDIKYTDPVAAHDFVEKTGIDALAVAIGTSHGAYKFTGTARLDIKRLENINKKVNIPLVLHGASEVPTALVAKAEHYGARLGHVEGVPVSQIKAAIHHGIRKINTDTDLRLAFDAALREVITKKPSLYDPRKILGPARNAMQKVVEQRIKLFGSSNKL